MRAKDIGLKGVALEVALELERSFQGVDFVSGRRSKQAQADAMSSNEWESPGWIRKTYKPSRAIEACATAVEDMTAPKTISRMRAVLFAVLCGLTDTDLRHISKHLSGEAWDLMPVDGPRGLAIKAWCKAMAAQHGATWLEQENGLIRWHWQAA